MANTNDGNGVAPNGIRLVSNFTVFGQLTRELMWHDRQTRSVINPQAYIIHKEIKDSENDSMT
jgi:hypothetical protein